jgi:hypothetical protein
MELILHAVHRKRTACASIREFSSPSVTAFA